MKSFRNYLIATALLLGILTVLIPRWYDLPYPMKVGPKFDKRVRPLYIKILNEEQPDMLLIGDSMLGAAVDESEVASRINKKIHVSSLPGTASTIWYAIIKNNIVVAEYKPEYLVVFFRDSMMTVPSYRVPAGILSWWTSMPPPTTSS